MSQMQTKWCSGNRIPASCVSIEWLTADGALTATGVATVQERLCPLLVNRSAWYLNEAPDGCKWDSSSGDTLRMHSFFAVTNLLCCKRKPRKTGKLPSI